MAQVQDAAFVRHNHNGGQALPFGRLKPVGQCPRCDQLRAGAAPRDAHPALRAVQRRREDEAQQDAARREHFAPGGPHARGVCGPVCTAFDY